MKLYCHSCGATVTEEIPDTAMVKSAVATCRRCIARSSLTTDLDKRNDQAINAMTGEVITMLSKDWSSDIDLRTLDTVITRVMFVRNAVQLAYLEHERAFDEVEDK